MEKPTNETDDKVHQWVKRALRSEMVKRGISYAALSDRLVHFGVAEEEVTLRNRVSRGAFSAAFFFQCMAAMGCRTFNIDLAEALYEPAPQWPSEVRAAAEETARVKRKPGKQS
ncbi:MAG: DUF6471 domain-containing protein [Rhizomicrobium sp.]